MNSPANPFLVVFLDVDGVVLPFGPCFDGPQAKACAERINRLVQTLGAKVVISSSWRIETLLEGHDWRVGHLTDKWRGAWDFLQKNAGLNVPVIGMTPDLFDPEGLDFMMQPGTRGAEIQAWLDEHPEVTAWIAIDDIPEWIGPEKLPRTVVTDSIIGFTEADLQKALALFAGS